MKNIKWLPLFLASSYVIKALFIKPSLEECFISLALIAMSYGYEFFASEKKISQCLQEIKLLSDKIDAIEKRTDNVQTQIASVKLNSGIRTQKLG